MCVCVYGCVVACVHGVWGACGCMGVHVGALGCMGVHVGALGCMGMYLLVSHLIRLSEHVTSFSVPDDAPFTSQIFDHWWTIRKTKCWQLVNNKCYGDNIVLWGM